MLTKRNQKTITAKAEYKQISLSMSKQANSFFTESTLETETPKLLENISDELAIAIRHKILDKIACEKAPEREKIAKAKKAITELSDKQDLIIKLSTNAALMNAIAEREDLIDDTPSFLAVLGKHLLPAMITNLFPGGLLIGSLLPTMAAATSFQVFSGVPTGMTGFCQSLQVFCAEGYVLDSNNNLITHFERVFNPTGSGNSGSASLLIQNCLSVEAIGNMTASYILGNNVNGTNICASSSGIFNSLTVEVQATQMQLSSCVNYNELLQPIYQNCMNQASSTSSLIAIIAGSVGGAAAIIMFAFCIWKMRQMGKMPSNDMQMNKF